MLAPIVSVNLTRMYWVSLHHLFFHVIETTQLEENISIIVMPLLLRAFQNTFDFQLPQKESWLYYREGPDSGQRGKSLHF